MRAKIRPRVGQAAFAMALVSFLCVCLSARSFPQDAKIPPPPMEGKIPRLTIQVTAGDHNEPVENASVYVKFTVQHKLWKDKKYELDVKTDHEGLAHIPDPPLGTVLIQIVAEHWRPFGKDFEITNQNQVIKIHLEKPPKWY
jgi:hypothetical protein